MSVDLPAPLSPQMEIKECFGIVRLKCSRIFFLDSSYE